MVIKTKWYSTFISFLLFWYLLLHIAAEKPLKMFKNNCFILKSIEFYISINSNKSVVEIYTAVLDL